MNLKNPIERLGVIILVFAAIFSLAGIGYGLIEESRKEHVKPETKDVRNNTFKYVFKDETYCEVFVIASDLPEDSVESIVRKLYPDESEIKLINKIEVPTTSVE
jgi:hypothetical protein